MSRRDSIFRMPVLVWLGLVALTTGTLLLSFVARGKVGVTSALAFAVAKAALVGWFYMHLRSENASLRAAFSAGFAFLALILGLSLLDVEAERPLLRPAPEDNRTGASEGVGPRTGEPGPFGR